MNQTLYKNQINIKSEWRRMLVLLLFINFGLVLSIFNLVNRYQMVYILIGVNIIFGIIVLSVFGKRVTKLEFNHSEGIFSIDVISFDGIVKSHNVLKANFKVELDESISSKSGAFYYLKFYNELDKVGQIEVAGMKNSHQKINELFINIKKITDNVNS